MPTIEVLGTAQDAGVPHLGCGCDRCAAARSGGRRRYASSLLLRDDGEFLFDATPDLRFQVETVPDGVFLTHAHLGHVPGLLFFGREAVDADAVPVYATSGLSDVVRSNAPFSLLVADDNVELRPTDPGSRVSLGSTTVTGYSVPHRESLPTGTLAYVIDGPETSVLYMSDIDAWSERTRELVREVDVALVDGTFWSREELGRVDDVPHPTIRDSIETLDPTDTRICFTHCNHTNPVLDAESAARKRLEQAGFEVLTRGDTFEL